MNERSTRKLWAFAFVVAGSLAGAPGLAAEDEARGPVDDVYQLVAAIAAPTAGARMGGGSQKFEKIVTIGREANRGAVVTSIQAKAAEADPTLPAGTIGVMIVHHEGQCAAPYGNDGKAVADGVATYVVSPSGKHIWQVAADGGVTSFRLVRDGGDVGAWEPLQAEPSAYRTYPCKRYK